MTNQPSDSPSNSPANKETSGDVLAKLCAVLEARKAASAEDRKSVV